MNNHGQYHHISTARQLANSNRYTYDLPYAIRKDICNLLDANQSWKELGGCHMGLSGTQLAVIGLAYMRNTSPTEELFDMLDTANARVEDLSFYLRQMKQFRALELLRPFVIAGNSHTSRDHGAPDINFSVMMSGDTLHTPTHSIGDSSPRPAIMGPTNGFSMSHNEPLLQDQPKVSLQENAQYIEPELQQPTRCHRSTNQTAQISSVPYDQEVVNQLRLIMQITHDELRKASDNFSNSNILGNGGFASVYRGNWKGTDVAIKRLKCNLMDQALNELSILNSYKIDNILPIYGISIDGPEACLIYQFMANGSLEDRLSCKNGTQPLSWQQRALIGEGVAKGLYYLHTVRDKPLVHGDVKSANVLLDAQFVPKLGDFGLARQVFKNKDPQTELCTHCTVSSIHGTSVYLPPEYLRHKILSPAVDVYSYGIVLLEMATGRRAYDGKQLLINLVEDETRSILMGQIGYSLKDSRLKNDSQTDLKIWFELLIKLGISCTHKIKKKRLDMGQVLSRFVDFRNDSLKKADSNANPDECSSTVTADPTPTPRLAHQQKDQGAIQVPGFIQDVPHPDINSALMSFEEERREDRPVDVTNHIEANRHNTPEQSTQLASNGAEAPVDAMIPLLTELGLNQNSADL